MLADNIIITAILYICADDVIICAEFWEEPPCDPECDPGDQWDEETDASYASWSETAVETYQVAPVDTRSDVCHLCSKTFANRRNLNVHLQTVHNKERPWKCSTCDQEFALKQHLQRHQNVHTHEKPYKCEVCSKTFSLKFNMDMHIKTVHVGERKWQCSTCGSTFAQKVNLQAHERVHSGEKPYECELCSKTFTQKANLVVHLKTIHFGERRWRCSICGCMFGRKAHLISHQMIHVGGKPEES